MKEYKEPKRTCDGCTKCCDGWLHGQAYEHVFYPGRPCFFKSASGCSIYSDRPASPCREYECFWLAANQLPMWMRPDLANIIVTERTKDNVVYYDIEEAGQTIQSHILNWLTGWAIGNGKNIKYKVSGGINKIGSKQFMELEI